MQTVKTIPGKTYAVESAGEVTITNTETGAIAAQGDGSGQVLFTACANSYTVSDDAAKVVALFKLAPRLKLARLQGGAGGWLPAGYTELEYLESSGTQFIDTGEFLDSEWSVTITAANTAPNDNNNSFSLFGFSRTASIRFMLSVYCEDPTKRNVAWVGLGDFGELFLSWNIDTSLFHTYSLNKSMLTFDGSPALEIQTAPFSNSTYTSFLFKYNSVNRNGFIGRVTSAILYKEGSKKRDFRPVLDADGIPCMYDTVSRTCFYNAGSGKFGYRIKRTGESVAPMSLRDPYYTAPSGVWARLAGENELEIVADTEDVQGDDWVWFANTGDAYEHFGITLEEILTE